MLLSNFADPRSDIVLAWKAFAWTGGATAEIRIVDATRDFSEARTELVAAERASLHLTLKAPAVALIRLRPTEGAAARTTLSVTSPANRLVFQRSRTGDATIQVGGSCAWPGAVIEARMASVATGRAGAWTVLGTVRPDFSYRGQLTNSAGWYSLEIRARSGRKTAHASVERVGVG